MLTLRKGYNLPPVSEQSHSYEYANSFCKILVLEVK